MNNSFAKLKKLFLDGLLFLLPVIVVLILLAKVWNMLTGISGKLAAVFGLTSIAGISGATIVTSLSIVVLCLACGFLARLAMFGQFNQWIDNKLAYYIPGYETYRAMAMQKLHEKSEVLPYKQAVWVDKGGMSQPGFLIESLNDGSKLIFFPAAGNVKEGTVYSVPSEKVHPVAGADINAVQSAISKLGVGLKEIA